MIYYIIVVDKYSHDEYVHSTYNSVEGATEWVEKLRAQGSEALEYRIDAIPNNKELTGQLLPSGGWQLSVKDKLNREYGRAKMDHEEGYPDTDSVREARHSSDFTIEELFPQIQQAPVAYTLTCAECSCEVKNQRRFLKHHTAWHNKLLP